MINNSFTIIEIFILLLLFLSLLLPLRLINKSKKLSFLNPLIIFSLIFSYYNLVSPVFRVLTNETIDRGIDFRDLFIYGWVGSLVSVLSLYVGYFSTTCKSLIKYRTCNLNSNQLWKIGFWINNIGIIGYVLVKGLSFSVFNPFDNVNTTSGFLSYRGAFQNYLLYAQDFLTSGTLLMVTSYLRNKKRGLITFAFLLITIGIYLSSGFRYKLFFLTFAIFLFYFLVSNFTPKIYFFYLSIGLLFFGFINSLLEIIRVPRIGINLENLRFYSISDIFLNIFKLAETSIFLTTSGLISIVPSKFSYVYFYPFYKVLIHPIPSRLFAKEPGDYINDVLLALYQSDLQVIGAAIQNYGEYYLMFGWFGIIIGSYIFGKILKKIWIWILIHQEEEIALPIYLLNASYIFMIISRGYLPQQFHLYAFSILPLIIVYILNIKNLKTNTY